MVLNGSNDYYIKRQELRESSARSYPRKFPFAIKEAHGVHLVDVEGKDYIDFLCGAGTLALGHNDLDINKALVDTIQSGAMLHGLDLATPIKDEFTSTLFELLPGKLKGNAKIQFCSPAGTDALDAAVKLCKVATGRRTVVVFSGAYHGMGQGTLAMMGNLHAKSELSGLMNDVNFFPAPYSYRCPFGLGGDAGVKAACQYFERTLKDPESGIVKPACVVIEPIQGEGGVIPMPSVFLKTLRRVTEELDIPLIFDEVQCGVGRSGTFFAFEDSGVVPDVICLSKAIGGSQPMAVVVYDKSLDKWTAGTHAGTFRGNQLAMAAGIVVIKKVSQKAFLDDVKRKGELILSTLNALKKKVSIIADVRGRGMMLGVELINPKTEADSIASKRGGGEVAAAVQRLCFERGLIMEKGGREGAVLRCLTALNIPDSDLKKGLEILQSAIIDIDKQYK